MKCKWYDTFEGACANGDCPYRGDTCPTSEHPEVCKHAEEDPEIPRLNVAELVKTLRLCDSASCTGCALYGFYDCGSIINPQAADMLEKLAAERDAKKPEWISVKDRLPEKKNESYLCCVDSYLFTDSQYVDIRVFRGDGTWELGKNVTHWMPLPELPKEEER